MKPIMIAAVFTIALSLFFSHTNAVHAQDTAVEPFSFVQNLKISPDDKITEDRFATSVAVHNDVAVIGVPQRDPTGFSSGAVYIFSRDTEGNWTPGPQLLASDGVAGDFFGTSVAVNDTVVLVGARSANNGGNFSGAVYVFTRSSAGTWNQTQKLTPSDATAGRFFGWSLALTDDTALIGAPGNGDDPNFSGVAYLFSRDDSGSWTETHKLSASDGIGRDEFGFSVALFTSTALVGARSTDENGPQSGAAYLFTPSASGEWTQSQKFTASDGLAGDEFGHAVALTATTVTIGARFATGAEPHTGAVYVYQRQEEDTQGSWVQVQKLSASDSFTGDEFGASLALNSDTLLISAPQQDGSGAASGIVYLFAPVHDETLGLQWTERQQIRARDAAAGDTFGFSLALQGQVAIVGSPGDDIVVETTDEKNETTSTTIVNVGSANFFTRAAIPGTCILKTDYDDAQCSKTFFVESLEDLDQYFATDFGRKDNNNRYMHLSIFGNLTASILDIHSPCQITVETGPILTGDFVSLDGRQGVTGQAFRIDADRACLVSEQGSVTFGNRAVFAGNELTLQAPDTVAIGQDTLLTADGAVTLQSTGDSRSSNATIGSGTLLTAGALRVQAPRLASLQPDSSCTIDGSIFVTSTGDASGGEAAVQTGARIRATDLTVSSPRTARLGKNTLVSLSGNLNIHSSGNSSASQALIESGANLSVASDGEILSGNKATLDKKVHLSVEGNLRIEAGSSAQCKISGSAKLSAPTKSGNCF